MKLITMKKISSLSLGCFLAISFVNAQTIVPDDALILPEPKGQVTVNSQKQPIRNVVTDLRSTVYSNNTIVVVDEKDGAVYNIIPAESNVIQQRLQAIEGVMPMVYNHTTSQFIDFFMRRRPSFTKQMLEKKDFYFPVFEKYLAKYNMPDEMKYLALIESGLNPKAVSRAKAVGLWQFMPATGREVGLTINDYVDERMHIEKSTDAACRYLKTLYGMFHDWELALAAYNSGPGTVRRALRRSGKTDYWEIHNFIPSDTRTYVPQWAAIAYMMNFSADHNIFAEKPMYYFDSKSFTVNGYMDLRKLAELSATDYATFQLLNPHLKVDILPVHTRNLDISLPLGNHAIFEADRANILAIASTRPYIDETQLAQNTFSDSEPLASATYNTTSNGNEPVNVIEDLPVKNTSAKLVPTVRTVTKYHKVRRGENLSTVADRYNVYIADVKRWNGLRSSKILVGQRLKIYTKETKYVNSEGNSIASNNNYSKPSKVATPVKFYTVKPGDTLWSISQRYGGVSINDIKQLNNLKTNTVKVGQRLKISS